MCGCWFQKVGPKEGSIEPSSWGRKVIRRWERREDYQAQESHLKRKAYQLTSQNSGPKAKTQSYQIPHWISTWTNEEQSGANRSRELDNLKCTKWHYEEQASEELHNCKLYIWSLQALLILEAYEDSITVGQSCLPCSLYALCIHQFCRDGWRDSYCDPQNLMRSGDWRERERFWLRFGCNEHQVLGLLKIHAFFVWIWNFNGNKALMDSWVESFNPSIAFLFQRIHISMDL